MTPRAALEVEAVVRRLVDGNVARVGDVRHELLDYDAFLAGRTLTRVRGTAVVGERSVPWSFVEKCTDGPSVASAYLYDNGRREFTAYRSGLLEDLARGLRAPELLAAGEGHDGRLTLWIEDLSAGGRRAFSPDEVVIAARHLGRLAGRWIGRVPDDPWLFRGWIDRHRQPHAIEDGLAIVSAARRDAGIGTRIGGRLDEAARLIAAQDEYASALRTLTQTLCHHDAVAANVFPGERDGAPETVLIDWESVGPGPVGADLASLLFSSPRRGDFSSHLLGGLIPRALEAYLGGLSDSGASLDADEVRLGVHASVSLRWTLVRDVIRVLDGTSVARRGSAPDETTDEALDELVALVPTLLDSAAEARSLISAPLG